MGPLALSDPFTAVVPLVLTVSSTRDPEHTAVGLRALVATGVAFLVRT